MDCTQSGPWGATDSHGAPATVLHSWENSLGLLTKTGIRRSPKYHFFSSPQVSKWPSGCSIMRLRQRSTCVWFFFLQFVYSIVYLIVYCVVYSFHLFYLCLLTFFFYWLRLSPYYRFSCPCINSERLTCYLLIDYISIFQTGSSFLPSGSSTLVVFLS